MIRDYKEPPYLICGRCRKAFKGWEAYNEMTDDYTEGPDEVGDPLYYVYKSGTNVECPMCKYYDIVYGVHLPKKFEISCGNRSLTMSIDEVSKPPEIPKRFSLGSGSRFSLPPANGRFSFQNRKKGIKGMRRLENPDKGSRRWN